MSDQEFKKNYSFLKTFENEIDMRLMPEMLSDQISTKIKEKIDDLMVYKLEQIQLIALQNREYQLADILRDINKNNVEKKQKELSEAGYIIHADVPNYKTSFEEGTYKTTIDHSKMKVKVYQELCEV